MTTNLTVAQTVQVECSKALGRFQQSHACRGWGQTLRRRYLEWRAAQHAAYALKLYDDYEFFTAYQVDAITQVLCGNAHVSGRSAEDAEGLLEFVLHFSRPNDLNSTLEVRLLERMVKVREHSHGQDYIRRYRRRIDEVISSIECREEYEGTAAPLPVDDF